MLRTRFPSLREVLILRLARGALESDKVVANKISMHVRDISEQLHGLNCHWEGEKWRIPNFAVRTYREVDGGGDSMRHEVEAWVDEKVKGEFR
jgi:hypothetical protein